jgi:hypothetical protein
MKILIFVHGLALSVPTEHFLKQQQVLPPPALCWNRLPCKGWIPDRLTKVAMQQKRPRSLSEADPVSPVDYSSGLNNWYDFAGM